jgi:hypothetical protein
LKDIRGKLDILQIFLEGGERGDIGVSEHSRFDLSEAAI